jgi:ABC-type dipeptide/oligopeptide/nickel transport system permease subunit
LADLLLSVPALLVTIVVAGIGGGGYALAVGALVVLTSPGDIRLVRAAVLESMSTQLPIDTGRSRHIRPTPVAV